MFLLVERRFAPTFKTSEADPFGYAQGRLFDSAFGYAQDDSDTPLSVTLTMTLCNESTTHHYRGVRGVVEDGERGVVVEGARFGTVVLPDGAAPLLAPGCAGTPDFAL